MSLVKIVALLFIFLYALPIMTVLCCLFPFLRHLCFAGMLYFTSNEYSLNILPMPKRTGTARGYAFTAVSFFAVPLLLSMCFSLQYKVRFFPPGTFFYFLYWLANILSGINAAEMHPWGFEIYKMFWMYVTFLAAFNYLNNCKNLTFFVYLICFILIVIFLVGLNQKYRIGRFQISSTFPHQNSLALYVELAGLLVLGILMNERMSKILLLLTMIAFGGSVLLIIFTYSRGGLVVYFGGIAIVCALSILVNGFSLRRLTLMLLGMIVMLSVTGYALPRIIQRFTKAPEQSKNTRIELAIGAKIIADEYRLGVGANHFSRYSGPASKRVPEQTTELLKSKKQDIGAIVETIYLLVAAECGWWGLGTLLLWFFYYYFSVIISVIALRKKPCSGFVIGLFGGLTCNYWHSTLEWSLKQNNNFAMQMILYALIGVIAVHRKDIRAAYKRQQEEKRVSRRKKRLFRPQLSFPAPETAGDADGGQLKDFRDSTRIEPEPLPQQ